jgi:AcrR family transcriptional regulator
MSASRSPGAATKRPYNSARRSQQAAQTRVDVLTAAAARFREHGWAGTTLQAIAEDADVAVETIYKAFGSKKALLRQALDVSLVGDAEPVPLVDRPEFLALADGTVAERIAYAASLSATINERSADIWQALVAASSGDPEVDAWRFELETGRRVDVGRSIERVLGAPVDDRTLDAIWLLFGPETYSRLVGERGMSRAEYEAFLVDMSYRILPTG